MYKIGGFILIAITCTMLLSAIAIAKRVETLSNPPPHNASIYFDLQQY